MEPKKYDWGVNGVAKTGPAFGGYSRNSSQCGSKSHLDMGGMVENILKEEIGEMAKSLQKGSSGVVY